MYATHPYGNYYFLKFKAQRLSISQKLRYIHLKDLNVSKTNTYFYLVYYLRYIQFW